MTLDEQIIAQALTNTRLPSGAGFTVSCLDRVTSTNEIIKNAIREGAPEGFVVTSLEQSGGYGRQGRVWQSKPGGLYLSVLLRPLAQKRSISELPTLGHAIALAVRALLIAEGVDTAILIKWPNDIVCDAGKLAGISCEAIGEAVCIGIGINVLFNYDAQMLDGKYVAAYSKMLMKENEVPACVSENGLSSHQLGYMATCTAHLLKQIARVYDQWILAGFDPLRAEYQACSSLMGQAVSMVSLSGDVKGHGIACGIDHDGHLVVKKHDGELLHVASEEVHLL